jgi:hypothetical protein
MVRIGLTTEILKVLDTPAEDLGAVVTLFSGETDTVLYYTRSGAPVVGSSQVMFKPTSADTAIYKVAGQGNMEWIYVKANSGGLSAGAIAVRDLGGDLGVVKTGTSEHPDNVVGMAVHAIGANKYGWILRRGVWVGSHSLSAGQAGKLSSGAWSNAGGDAGACVALTAGKLLILARG